MQNKLTTPEELQDRVSALSDRIDALKSSMRGKSDRMKELDELLRMVQFYTEGKPIADKLATTKWKGKREQFMSENENALRLYHMAERKLKPYFKDDKLPITAWRKERDRLEQAQRRMGELDRLFIRIYEDNVAGRINDERFSMMSRSYETEQEQLKLEIQTLQQDIEVQERQIENLEQFIQRVHKYKDLDELTPYALRELVKGVYIEAPDKSSGKRRQNIRISYDLVGFIPLNELMKEETA